MPKFSIITVSYNSGATIQQTIDSVLNQTFKDFEYIIIDGASTDNTLEILSVFDGKVKYLSEPDTGIYNAMNKGLKMATGDIIGMIGADDFYPANDVLEKVNEAFETHKTDAIYGDKQYVNPDNIDKIVRYWKVGNYQKENWLNGWMPPHLSFYLKKTAYDKYGYYLENFKCSADYELMLRMLYKNNVSVAYLPKVIMTMRNGGTSTASWQHRLQANQEDRLAWKLDNLKPRWYTLWWKPISKITQLFKKSS